jgi:hypothetical protein
MAGVKLVRATRETDPAFKAFTDDLLAAVQSRVLSPVFAEPLTDDVPTGTH